MGAVGVSAAFLVIRRLPRTAARNKLTLKSPPPSDIEIAQSVAPPVRELFARALGSVTTSSSRTGCTREAVAHDVRPAGPPDGNYVVVVGINPTPHGGQVDDGRPLVALGAHLGQKVMTCIRQPSMGPTFGIKGGAAGGGYLSAPMEDFNLHMTGDIHDPAANNLFSAAIDARIFHERTASTKFIFDKLCLLQRDGSRAFEPSMHARLDKLGIATRDPTALTPDEVERFCRLDIDPSSVTWKRVTDTNDRFLRGVTLGRGPAECNSRTGERFERESGFAITVASEIMAVLTRDRPRRPPRAARPDDALRAAARR